MNVATLMFLLKNGLGLIGRQPPRSFLVMLNDETSEWLSDDQTDIERKTWIGSG